MIIAKKFIEEINSLVRNITLIFRGNKASPRFSWISGPKSACLELPRRLGDVPSKKFIVLGIKPDVIFVDVRIQLIGA